MIHAAIWLVSSAIGLYATAIITGALFSLSSKDKDKEGARIFGYIIAPFIVIAVLIVHALWRL
jgi:nitrogen fixation/metabolism regulation signal transduction histidine kinase